MNRFLHCLLCASGAIFLLAGDARADDTVALTLKNHQFSPKRLEVPAGKKITIVLKNEDSESEEFDSTDLRREKVVKGGQEIQMIVGPLDAGEYKFVGEYHEDTAVGVLVAK